MSTITEVNAYEAEVREIVGKLPQSDRNTIADWLTKQHRLEDADLVAIASEVEGLWFAIDALS